MSMDEPDQIAKAVSDAENASAEGDHARAEQALRRALWLQEAHFGHVHPEVANTLNNLGVVCDTLGRPNEAEFLYRRALGLARTTLPAGHPYIETSLENLKALYRTQGRPEKLALVSDSETSRSGLPIHGAGDVDIDIDAPVPEELPGAGRSAPASVAGSQVASAQEKRPDAIYGQLAQPSVLMVAAASIPAACRVVALCRKRCGRVVCPVEPPVVTRATEPPVFLQPDVAVELVAEPDDPPPRFWSHRQTDLPRYPRTRSASGRRLSSRRVSAISSSLATTTDRYRETGDAKPSPDPWTRAAVLLYPHPVADRHHRAASVAA